MTPVYRLFLAAMQVQKAHVVFKLLVMVLPSLGVTESQILNLIGSVGDLQRFVLKKMRLNIYA